MRKQVEQRIYIDVLGFIMTDFLTGIQRVVKSAVLEMAKNISERLYFLAYDNDSCSFMLINREAFLDYLKGNKNKKTEIYTNQFLQPSELGSGNIFFDIDSVWNLPYKRSVLLPELKRAGLRLAVFVHDIIPITEPHFCHSTTVFNFMSYIGAYLQYADLIITSTKSAMAEVNKLSDSLGLPRIAGFVSGLGADFTDEQSIRIPRNVRAATTNKYILCVGTIEPRKNHAYILDACEKSLFAKGFNLVFAGRLGWNMDAFQERILACSYLNKQLFWLQGMDDRMIDYLYRHAFIVAFPTYNEGYGLPIVEALHRGTPVVTTDLPVLKEVGGDYCEYIDLNSKQSVIDVITFYDENPEKYLNWKEKIRSFTPMTWKECSERMMDALNTLTPKERSAKKRVRQMVLLSARPDDLAKTLPFIDAFMPFIEEIVICCPDKVQKEMQSVYKGRLNLRFLPDNKLLNSKALPEDHLCRNFHLRCLAMKSTELDDVFIMSDDDYRPLEMISMQQFVTGNRYRAYYFYDLNNWHISVGESTSYDNGQDRILAFLKDKHYPTLQYSSHMPQIIDREIYLEMLDTHKELESLGVDEWSVYFNYLQYHYPNLVSVEPYLTIGWPAHGFDGPLYTMPQAFIFENYYDELYEKGGIFEGFSKEYYPGIEEENREKVKIAIQNLKIFQSWKDQYQFFCKSYEMEYGCAPSFCLTRNNGKLKLTTPIKLELPLHGVVRLPFFCSLTESSIQSDVSMTDAIGNYVMLMPTQIVKPYQQHFDLPIYGGTIRTKAGTYQLVISFTVNRETVRSIVPVTCL